MSVDTYTKSGVKSTTPAKLDKNIFGVKARNHQLLKDAYLAYLANDRDNFAKAKRRGEVRGGGQKPWRQKGTGRARFGSSRNPVWTGGGVAFGPTGSENYSRKLNSKAKAQALRQALSIAASEGRLKVIEQFVFTENKLKPTLLLIKKIGAEGNVLLVVDHKDESASRATRNAASLKLVHAPYLSVFDVMNADSIVIAKPAMEMVEKKLGEKDE